MDFGKGRLGASVGRSNFWTCCLCLWISWENFLSVGGFSCNLMFNSSIIVRTFWTFMVGGYLVSPARGVPSHCLAGHVMNLLTSCSGHGSSNLKKSSSSWGLIFSGGCHLFSSESIKAPDRQLREIPNKVLHWMTLLVPVLGLWPESMFLPIPFHFNKVLTFNCASVSLLLPWWNSYNVSRLMFVTSEMEIVFLLLHSRK